MRAERLRRGDTMGVCSPSFGALGLFPHRGDQAVANLRHSLGLRVSFSSHAFCRDTWVSAPAADRAQDLHALFLDPEITAIITAIGGDHANQMLPYLDWDLIRTHPKIFVGYSDGTVLSLAIHQMTRLVTFFGPALVPTFGEYPVLLRYTQDFFERALMQPEAMGLVRPSLEWTDEYLDWSTREDQIRARTMRKNAGPLWLRRGEGEGRLVGGCFESLEHLRGTRYWPDFSGALLFLELSEEAPSPSRVDAMLSDYENMGVLGEISGILLGRLYRYPDEDVDTLYQVFRDRTARWNLPILANLDFGHTDPMITIPVGVQARMSAAGWEILEGAVR